MGRAGEDEEGCGVVCIWIDGWYSWKSEYGVKRGETWVSFRVDLDM